MNFGTVSLSLKYQYFEELRFLDKIYRDLDSKR